MHFGAWILSWAPQGQLCSNACCLDHAYDHPVWTPLFCLHVWLLTSFFVCLFVLFSCFWPPLWLSLGLFFFRVLFLSDMYLADPLHRQWLRGKTISASSTNLRKPFVQTFVVFRDSVLCSQMKFRKKTYSCMCAHRRPICSRSFSMKRSRCALQTYVLITNASRSRSMSEGEYCSFSQDLF